MNQDVFFWFIQFGISFTRMYDVEVYALWIWYCLWFYYKILFISIYVNLLHAVLWKQTGLKQQIVLLKRYYVVANYALINIVMQTMSTRLFTSDADDRLKMILT